MNHKLGSSLRPLRGIIPPVITPLAGIDALDEPGLDRVLDRLVGGGVHGLFLLGTTGEGPCHSYRLRRELISRSCAKVQQRLPVLVAMTDTSYAESINIARHAADCGVDAVVVAPPYYFSLSQDALADYMERLVDDSPLPVFLYNIPSMTRNAFGVETVRRLMQREKVLGIKDSSGDLSYFDRLLAIGRERDGWATLMGPEEFIAHGIAAGASGGVPGGANIAPRLFVDLYEAALRQDAGNLVALQAKVMLLGRIYRAGGYGLAVAKGVKCALGMMAVCSERTVEPFTAYEKAEKSLIGAILEELKNHLKEGAERGAYKGIAENLGMTEQKKNDEAVGRLGDLLKRGRVTLLYAAHDPAHNDALVLAAYLCERLMVRHDAHFA